MFSAGNSGAPGILTPGRRYEITKLGFIFFNVSVCAFIGGVGTVGLVFKWLG